MNACNTHSLSGSKRTRNKADDTYNRKAVSISHVHDDDNRGNNSFDSRGDCSFKLKLKRSNPRFLLTLLLAIKIPHTFIGDGSSIQVDPVGCPGDVRCCDLVSNFI